MGTGRRESRDIGISLTDFSDFHALTCKVATICADFAGATGAIAPAVKILRGDAPVVTKEVAPVNRGGHAMQR